MLKVGSKAPDFKLTADDGSTVHLKALQGETVILYFYPKANTSGCTVEACEFSDLNPMLKRKGAVVLGVSPDPVKNLVKFRDNHGLTFRLLSDEDHKTGEAYGVWVEKSMYGRKYMGMERTTFVIGPDGKIAKIFVKVKAQGHAADVLRALQ
jgi:thioredoxin-dependent peroxiredoxin